MTDVIDLNEEREARAAPRKGLGYEPPQPTNWLAELPVNSRFLAKPKLENTSRLTEYVILTDPKVLGVCLLAENCQGRGIVDWRITELFSQNHTFYMTLTAELKDGNGNPLLNKPMDGDEEPPVTDS